MEQTKKTSKLRSFIEEVVTELKKVSWPGRRELYGATLVVLVVIVLISVGIGVVDALLGQIMQLLIRIGA
jgi:preprotein translocase subunit SecE